MVRLLGRAYNKGDVTMGKSFFFCEFERIRGSFFSSNNQQAYEDVDGAVIVRTGRLFTILTNARTLQKKNTTQNHVGNFL